MLRDWLSFRFLVGVKVENANHLGDMSQDEINL